jgi:hypothetical protein
MLKKINLLKKIKQNPQSIKYLRMKLKKKYNKKGLKANGNKKIKTNFNIKNLN